MALQFLLATVLLLLSAASTTTIAPAAAQALPGCSDKCGNLTISFPFGMEDGCYLREEFFINCSHTTQPPTAYLMTKNLIVTNFSLAEGELQILGFVAKDCYDAQGQTDRIRAFLTLPLPYTISDTRNSLIAVGCDTNALLVGLRGKGKWFGTGCETTCNSLDSVDKNSCSGVRCCQTNIPKGIYSSTIYLDSHKYHSDILEFIPCSYGFIVEQGQFSFSPASFQTPNGTKHVPMVLNWAIGNERVSCDEAQHLEHFACMGNSSCINRPINESVGYLCRCLPGYEGNPYHPYGCQDIDECKATNLCKNGQCKNIAPPGYYTCSCHKGYKNDKRCIKHDSKRRSKIVLLLVVSSAVGGSVNVGLMLLAITVWCLVRIMKKRKNKKRKEMFFKQNGGLVLEQHLSSGDQANVEKMKLFNSRELEKATNQFNMDRILGQGGPCIVYKGMLMDGQIVAIKKSKIVNGGEVGQFINEIVILSRTVVKLLGCYLETEIPLLVYEFLPNGTLSHYIHDRDEDFPLTWETRLRVSIEVAEALSYLHSATFIPIYHRNIKSANILLGVKYRAKVADFGTSRSISIDQTHLTTLVEHWVIWKHSTSNQANSQIRVMFIASVWSLLSS